MVSLIIGIIVAGIVVAVVLNKKKSHSDAAPIVAQNPTAPVESPAELVEVAGEPIATPEQKATRKANATKQAAAKKSTAKQTAAKKSVKKSK